MRKLLKAFGLIIILFWANTVYAQNDFEEEMVQAIALMDENKYLEALKIFNKYESSFHQELAHSKQGLAEILELYAICSFEVQLYVQAEQYFIESQQLYKEVYGEQHPIYANALNYLGGLYLDIKDFDKAEPLFIKAKEIREQVFTKKHPEYINSLNNLGGLYKNMGNYEAADQYYSEAVELIKEVLGKKPRLYATVLHNLAVLYEMQGNFLIAEYYYEEAINNRERIVGKANEDYFYYSRGLAGLYYDNKKYQKVAAIFNDLEQFVKDRAGAKHLAYAVFLNDWAGFYQDKYDFAKAKGLYKQSLSVCKESVGKYTFEYASIYQNLAGLYLVQTDFLNAELAYKEIKEVYQKTLGETHPEYLNSTRELAAVYIRQGNLEKAKNLLTDIKNTYEDNFDTDEIYYINICNDLGGVLHSLGQYKEAFYLYETALKTSEQLLGTDNEFYATTLVNIGGLNLDQGFYEESTTFFTKALAIRKKMLGVKAQDYINSLSNLALLYSYQNQYDKAEDLYQQVKKFEEETIGNNTLDYAKTLNNLANLYFSQNKFEQIAPLFKQASEIFIKQTENNFAHLSEDEQQTFLNTFKYNFEAYIAFVHKAKKIDLSSWLYNNNLALKSILLSNTKKMRYRIRTSEDADLKQLFNTWLEKRDFLSQIYQSGSKEAKKRNIDVAKLEEEVNELEKQLSLKSQVFASETQKKITWEAIQKSLKMQEVCIEVIRFRDLSANVLEDGKVNYLILMLSKGSKLPKMLVLENGDWLEKQGLKLYETKYKDVKSKGKEEELYKAFWKPIADLIHQQGNIKKVYFSADGVYHQINLETLYNPTTQKYLKEEVDIELVNSSKDILKNKQSKKNIRNTVLLGFPDYSTKLEDPLVYQNRSVKLSEKENKTIRVSRKGIAPLPGTKTEVLEIAKVMQKKRIKTQIYLEKNATEALVKKQKSPDILHIATHGFYIPLDSIEIQKRTRRRVQRDLKLIYKKEYIENPLLRSGLLLAGSEKALYGGEKKPELEDGILTAQEVMNLELDHTELVVLSACETGLGDVSVGEGVYGLQRSFQQAGAKSVIMSLWKVDDEVTQEFMLAFYENWLSKKMSKREAFKEAKKQIQAKHPAPYFWGAFVMIGE